jgi:hypothetical protein
MKGKVLRSASSLWIALVLSAQLAAAAPPVVVTDGSVNFKPAPGTMAIVRPLTTVSDSGTLTAGGGSAGCGSGSTLIRVGYTTGAIGDRGSYSPSTLTGGKTVADVLDQTVTGGGTGCPTSLVALNVSGFTANPGTSWLTSITCNSKKLTSSTATFSYASGVAAWDWPISDSFGFVSGDEYTCTIVHNDP